MSKKTLDKKKDGETMSILFCSACEVKITEPADDVLMPVEGMYACSIECEDVVTFDLW